MLTSEQLQERRKGIGGSDAAAVLGLSKWMTPLDLYYDKIGERQDFVTNEDAVHFGNVLEDVVATEYANRTGQKVHRVNQPQIHPEHSFIMANLDRRVVGAKKVLECKTANQYTSGDWGESGTDVVPDAYLIQVTHCMAVMGWAEADLAVLIGGQDFRIYNFELDVELMEMMIEAEGSFWLRVINREPPPATTKSDIDTYMAIDNGDYIVASSEVEHAVGMLKDVKAKLKEMGETKVQLETITKVYMGENSVLTDLNGAPLVTFKKAKDGNRLDSKALKAEEPELYRAFSKTTVGSRRFLVK